MKNITYLGVLLQLIGSAVLIYLGIAGTNRSNVGLVVGLALIVVGFLLHIYLDKKFNSLPSEK